MNDRWVCCYFGVKDVLSLSSNQMADLPLATVVEINERFHYCSKPIKDEWHEDFIGLRKMTMDSIPFSQKETSDKKVTGVYVEIL